LIGRAERVANEQMSAVAIDWSSAEVRDGRLEVWLDGDPPRGWKAGFTRTLALLNAEDGGKVRLLKGRIRVDGVPEGDEERLRHLLESAVTQANASHERRHAEADSAAGGGQGHDADQPKSVDAEMTGRFRSFADDGRDPGGAAPAPGSA
jgi:hypothetical protein